MRIRELLGGALLTLALLAPAGECSPRQEAGFSLAGWRFAEDRTATELPPGWSVDGDVLRGSGGAPPILSQWDQDDFELTFDWRVLDEATRAEVLVRAEDTDLGRGLAIGAGRHGILPGLVGSRGVPTLQNPVGEWNHWRFAANGAVAMLYCNERFAWGVRGLQAKRGYPGFLVHEGTLELRNVRIVEAEFEDLSEAEDWVGLDEHWSLADGELRYDGAGADLVSRDVFLDYVLRLEWRIPPGSNSGVYLRGTYPWQVEIWDDPRGSGLYLGEQPEDTLPPLRVADVPVGHWNFLEVALAGGRLTAWMNGQVIAADVDLATLCPDMPEEGPIGLQDHDTPVAFRNVRIRRLLSEGDVLTRYDRTRRQAPPRPEAGGTDGPLDAAGSLARLDLSAGFAARLVAAEPDVTNPVCLASAGPRSLYVSGASTYRDEPDERDTDAARNPIRLLRLDGSGELVDSVLAAGGFPSPVMGMAVSGERLFATCNERLLVLPIRGDGTLGPGRTLVRVRTTRWNPFGMYRVVLGRDGRLWFTVGGSVSEEGLVLEDADGDVLTVPGGGGGVFRCDVDGRNLELVVRGLRVAFGFELDPFGELWVVESGQDGPDRLLHAVPGADYGYESEHLEPTDPLVPPYLRLSGSFTSVLRYEGPGLPWYQRGELLVANWGSHGAAPRNRRIERYEEVRGELHALRPLFRSDDPLFRPTQVAVAPDEGLWVLDWQGADDADEDDVTGRLYHVAYRGIARGAELEPAPTQADLIGLEPEELARLLGDERTWARQAAREAWLVRGEGAIAPLRRYLEAEPDGAPPAVGACEALWILATLRTTEAARGLGDGLDHPDARVRALALRLLREAAGQPLSGGVLRATSPHGPGPSEDDRPSPAPLAEGALLRFAQRALTDPDPGVLLEGSLALPAGELRGRALLRVLALPELEPRLVHRAAAELGRGGTPASLRSLGGSPHPAALGVALATAIAERTPLAGDATAEVLRLLQEPSTSDLPTLMRLATLEPTPATRAALRATLKRPDVGTMELVRGLDTLLALGAETEALRVEVLELLRRLAREPFEGTPDDRVLLLRLLEKLAPPKLPVPFVLDSLSDTRNRLVMNESHRVVRALGIRDPRLSAFLADRAREGPGTLVRLAATTTLAAVAPELERGLWVELATQRAEVLAFDALRALGRHPGEVELARALLAAQADARRPRSTAYRTELRSAVARMGLPPAELLALDLPRPPATREELRREVLALVPEASAALGEQSFWTTTARCSACHSLDGAGGQRGPALDAIGAESSPESLLESILFPSATLKAGYEAYVVETRLGERYFGMVREEDGHLFVYEDEGEPTVLPLEEVASLDRQSLSIMPEGLEVELTPGELADLVAFLLTREGR